MKKAVKGLLHRLVHNRGKEFIIHINGLTQERDYFKVHSEGLEGEGVQVWAGTGVGAALGVMTYLKYFCNASVSWESDNLSDLPHVWPKADLQRKLMERYRYYNNPCVFSYSYAFWSWERWEREIDLMALMGVNLALALEGQEALWRSVYMALGVTEEEMQQHFTGPVFLAWGRMGNIEGWGGPLSLQWQQDKLQLQKRIVTRMREFGMYTVLPAFSGHVPKGILRVYPRANITRLPAWGHFSEPYTKTHFLHPQDPLFEKIGEAFIKKVIDEFGSDHFYLVDPFNEMTPLTSNPRYLQSASQSIFNTIKKADPQAVWVTQGWMFLSDKDFWQEEQAKAYLTAVPQGKMLILDLAAEVYPQYGRLHSYFGQPFIFCLLNNYGGVRGMFGNVDVLLKNLEEARQFPNTSLVGTGMTPEGIGSNYVLFDLLSEMSWRSHLKDPQEWAVQYSVRRYGIENKNLAEAWKLLMSSVFNCSEPMRYHGRYIPLMHRPKLNPKTKMWYNLQDLVSAWDLLIGAAKEQLPKHNNLHHRESNMILRPRQDVPLPSLQGNSTSLQWKGKEPLSEPNSMHTRGQREERRKGTTRTNGKMTKVQVSLLERETYKHDIVEVTREVMQIAASQLIKKLIKNYRRRDIVAIQMSGNELQELISDLNLLLGSNSAYLLGRWIQSAAQWSNQTKESLLLRRNCLYQISLWGPNGEILDYAVKQWNGVMWKYVSPRWDAFAKALLTAVESGVTFDKEKFNMEVFQQVEKPFAEDLHTFYPSVPIGDGIKFGVMMHGKYRHLFNQYKYNKHYTNVHKR